MFIFQFVNLRWWIKNEIKINQVNLYEIPPAQNVFQQAHIDMLPEGITTSGVVSYIPLQNLLDHSTKRYLCVCVCVLILLYNNGILLLLLLTFQFQQPTPQD